MVISALYRAYLSAFLASFLVGCSSCPSNVSNTIDISGWKISPPKNIVLEAYKKDSNFKIPIKNGAIRLNETDFPDMAKYLDIQVLFLKFDKFKHLPVDQDYRLVLDDKYEYKISKLVPARGGGLCPLGGALINECSLENSGSASISFNASCANILK